MKIILIDTGCSNLFSIKTTIHRLGYNPIITCDHKTILKADKIVLPGVGSAKTAMQQLVKHQLINILKDTTQPVLGICLGMQILAQHSEENEGIKTLAIINTNVQHMNHCELPLPHMGWNTITIQNAHPLFYKITNNDYFYFTHNYCIPICPETIAYTYYGTHFTSVIKLNNFFGVQFHPEKSSTSGQQLIKNFLEM